MKFAIDEQLQTLIDDNSSNRDSWFSAMRFSFSYQRINSFATEHGLQWSQLSDNEKAVFRRDVFEPHLRNARPIKPPVANSEKERIGGGMNGRPMGPWIAFTQGTGIQYKDPYLVLLFQEMQKNSIGQLDQPVFIPNPSMVVAIGIGAAFLKTSERVPRRDYAAALIAATGTRESLTEEQKSRHFAAEAPFLRKDSPIDIDFLDVIPEGFRWDLNSLKSSTDQQVDSDFVYLLHAYEAANLKEAMMAFQDIPAPDVLKPSPGLSSAPQSSNLRDQVVDLIQNGYRNLMLSGPPGTSKSYVVADIAKELMNRIYGPLGADAPNASVVNLQFHPAYSYEDFVEGWRPVEVTSDSDSERPTSPSFKLTDGKLLDAIFDPSQQEKQANWWRLNKDRVLHEGFRWSASIRGGADLLPPVFIVLDEVNRANIPRVFGEVLQLVEVSKRSNAPLLEDGADQPSSRDTSIRLASSGRSLAIPENFIFIATMNTSDRSIARIDDAFRRRFTFIDCQPDPARLAEIWQGIYSRFTPSSSALSADAIRFGFTKLNESLNEETYRDKKIGHTYFIPNPEEYSEGFTQDFLSRRWELQVLPYLQSIKPGLPGNTLAFSDLSNWNPSTSG